MRQAWTQGYPSLQHLAFARTFTIEGVCDRKCKLLCWLERDKVNEDMTFCHDCVDIVHTLSKVVLGQSTLPLLLSLSLSPEDTGMLAVP